MQYGVLQYTENKEKILTSQKNENAIDRNFCLTKNQSGWIK